MIAAMCTVISAAVSTGTYFALDYADLHIASTSTQSERSHGKSQDSQNGTEHMSRSKDETEKSETENTQSADKDSHKKPSSESSETKTDGTVTKTKKTGSKKTNGTDNSEQTNKTTKSEKSHSSSTSRSPSGESDTDNSSDKSKSGTSEKPSSSAIEDTDDELSYSDFIELYITELGGELSEEEVETLRNGSVTDAVNIILLHSGEDTATAVEEMTAEEIQPEETQADADEITQE